MGLRKLLLSGACQDSYTTFPNTNSFQGVLLADQDVTQEDCIRLCNALPTAECVAFDFNPGQKRCYRHVAGYLDRINTVTGITQFRRNNICGAGTTASSKGPVVTGPGGNHLCYLHSLSSLSELVTVSHLCPQKSLE